MHLAVFIGTIYILKTSLKACCIIAAVFGVWLHTNMNGTEWGNIASPCCIASLESEQNRQLKKYLQFIP